LYCDVKDTVEDIPLILSAVPLPVTLTELSIPHNCSRVELAFCNIIA
jgi:hypothetical protein